MRTPTGGAHAYFPATPGVEQRSWQAASAGVDFRGDGGYIIAPPSRRTIDGTVRSYEIADIAAHSVGLVDAARLRDFLDPRPAAPSRNSDAVTATVDAERLAAWVASRGEGERNRGLFWAACRLAENGTPPTDALSALGPAAAQAGLSEREITTTVRSAYRATQPAPEASPSVNAWCGPDHWCSRSATSPVASGLMKLCLTPGLCRQCDGLGHYGLEFEGCQFPEAALLASPVVGAFDPGDDREA